MRLERYHKEKPRRFYLFVFVCLLIFNLFLYRESLRVGFLSDDFHILSVVRESTNLLSFFITNLEGSLGGSSYGPMYNITVGLMYKIFGLHSIFYHLVSILLNTISSFLIVLIGMSLFRRVPVPLSSGVLFSVLHSRVEVIFWFSSLPHLLATTLAILSLFLYMRYRDNQKLWMYFLAMISFTTALFTKEFVIVLPIIFFIYDIVFTEDRRFVRFLKRYLPLLFIIIIYLKLRQYTTGDLAGGYGGRELILNPRHLARIFTELNVNMILPQPWRHMVGGWLNTQPFLFVSIIAIVTRICVWSKDKIDKVGLFLYASYLVATLPFLQLSFSPVTNEGERYTYFSSFLFILILSHILFRERDRFAKFIISLFLCIFVLVQVTFIFEKSVHWVDSSKLVLSVVHSILPTNFKTSDKLVYVGLPDNLHGAQALRNGLNEAISLLRYEDDIPHIEVVQLYTSPRGVSDRVYLREIDDSLILESEDLVFTGFPIKNVNDFTFEMQNFEPAKHLGSAIKISKGDSVISTHILYMDGGVTRSYLASAP